MRTTTTMTTMAMIIFPIPALCTSTLHHDMQASQITGESDPHLTPTQDRSMRVKLTLLTTWFGVKTRCINSFSEWSRGESNP